MKSLRCFKPSIGTLGLIVFVTATPDISSGLGPARNGQDPSQTITTRSPFSALVTSDKAVFSLPVPSRDRWIWRRPETKDNAQEYRMDVSLKNAGKDYTFGFYVWKRRSAARESGDLESLIRSGQTSVFERVDSRRMALIRDAGIKLKLDGNLLTITIRGRDNVARLFSGRPTDATFNITIPDEQPVKQTIPIVYQ